MKLIEVLELYALYLSGYVARQLTDAQYDGTQDVSNDEMRCHLRWMVEKCLGDLASGTEAAHSKIGKAMRWLGYVQGELRACGDFTLSQLRKHSRS